jgi:putative DNA primase/helicase
MGFLSNILKDYATTAEADFLTSKMRNGISCTLINAKNTRMVLLSEPSNDNDQEMKLNNALIKSLTGNDNITARALYKNAETFKPTFNVFLLMQ